MSYVLDTNAVIGLLKNAANIRDRFRAAVKTGAQIHVSSIVIFELWYGVARSARPEQNAEALEFFLSDGIEVLPFEQEDAIIAGEIRAVLGRTGTPIGPYDVLIATQAIRTHSTLVTGNAREFGRVEGLRLEDWSIAR